ncbi:MAG TPA: hypothetical protein VFQ39_03365, partial [Longimicrobium sp.]|nr:hypothetical protein [Longimicrobium sp.]
MIRNRLLLLAALLAPLAHAPAVSAQSGRLSVTIRDYDDQTCRAAVARSGADRTRPWWCIIGVARHPQGVAELTAPGARVVTDSDQAGGMLFTVVFPTGGDQARTLVLMARTGTGETAEERYLLTPGAYDPAHPERQTFTLTTTRPRVLGGGAGAQETAAPLLAQADASAPAGDLAQGAPASTQAAVAQPGAAAAPGTVAAAPAAPTEDLAGRHIRITEPREWSAMGTRGIITAPARRSVYVTGFADHPDGQVASVAVDGKPAALTRDGSLRVRFSGFVPVDSVSRDVQVVVYGQNGLPVIGHYQLNAVPSARAYDGSASNVFSSGFRGQRWAVVVGVSEYQDSSITPLRFADDDARA